MSDVPVQRTFAYRDVFVAPEDDPRIMANFTGEHNTLSSYLDNYRKTLELKCSGLGAGALARQSVPPSDLSLLGLVRHMADVERFWFRQVLGQEESEAHFQEAFTEATGDDACVSEAWAAWHQEVDFARQYLAGVSNLDTRIPMPNPHDADAQVEVRDVVVHMIEEYARHMGHADFLRERIDGKVGV